MNKNLGKFVEITVRVCDEILPPAEDDDVRYGKAIEIIPEMDDPNGEYSHLGQLRFEADGSFKKNATHACIWAEEFGRAVEQVLIHVFQGRDYPGTPAQWAAESSAVDASHKAIDPVAKAGRLASGSVAAVKPLDSDSRARYLALEVLEAIAAMRLSKTSTVDNQMFCVIRDAIIKAEKDLKKFYG